MDPFETENEAYRFRLDLLTWLASSREANGREVRELIALFSLGDRTWEAASYAEAMAQIGR